MSDTLTDFHKNARFRPNRLQLFEYDIHFSQTN